MAAESRVLGAKGTRGVVVRPPMVYGDGAGPVAGLVQAARAAGVAEPRGNKASAARAKPP